MKQLRKVVSLLVLLGTGVCFSQVPDPPAAATSQSLASSSGCSVGTEDQRVVVVQAKVKNSGVVKDAKVLTGTAALGPAAISAVKARKYEFVRESTHLRTIELAVTFAADCDTVVDISQLVLVSGTVNSNTLANIEQRVRAGASGCVTPHGVRVSKDEMEARLRARVDPVYPPKARARRIEGTVVLNILVDKKGDVIAATKASGPDTLVQVAIDAVKQWKFEPFMIEGEPLEVGSVVDVKFAP